MPKTIWPQLHIKRFGENLQCIVRELNDGENVPALVEDLYSCETSVSSTEHTKKYSQAAEIIHASIKSFAVTADGTVAKALR